VNHIDGKAILFLMFVFEIKEEYNFTFWLHGGEQQTDLKLMP